ncbi:saposin-C-like isoform X2 [Amphiura filiformis]|uniref:saposin-C-like isoform X2 n=1 Tax=Amphiura filiformis TaxID=82378 RepID=UPI003B212970
MSGFAKLSSFLSVVLILSSIGIVSAEEEASSCVLCEFVMKELGEIIGSNASEKEIVAGVENVCSHLPTTILDECTILVDDYADAIIDLLARGVSTQMVCTEIGLCGMK